MNILHEPNLVLNEDQIKLVEEKYNVKFIMNSCIRDREGNWVNQPFAIFYSEEKHPEGSHYMAVFWDYNDLWSGNPSLKITDGISATEPFSAIKTRSGDVIYSAYRHNYRSHDGIAIDGGRDYTKINGDGYFKQLILQINNGELIREEL